MWLFEVERTARKVMGRSTLRDYNPVSNNWEAEAGQGRE